MFLSQVFYKDKTKMVFRVGNDVAFTEDDFHSITGLKIEASDYSLVDDRENRLKEQYFSFIKKGLKVENLYNFLKRHSRLPSGAADDISVDVEVCDEDAVKLAELYIVEVVLLGKEPTRNISDRSMKIIDDAALCASFSWGSFCFEELIDNLSHLLSTESVKKKTIGRIASYTAVGFPFLFNVWTMEVFNDFRQYAKYEDRGPIRMLSYSSIGCPKYDTLVNDFFRKASKFKVFKVNQSYLLKSSSKVNVNDIVNRVSAKVEDIVHADFVKFKIKMKKNIKDNRLKMKKHLKNSVKDINQKLDIVLKFIQNVKKGKEQHDDLLNDEDESNELQDSSRFSNDKHDKSSEHENSESSEQGDYIGGENDSDRDFAHLSGDKLDEEEKDVELPKENEQLNKEFEDAGPSNSRAPIMDIESIREEANKATENECRAHMDSIPLAMDINSVHGAQVTEEGLAASGILLEGPCHEVRPECNAVEPFVTAGKDVEAMIVDIADGKQELSTSQSNEKILRNTTAELLIPSIMNVETVMDEHAANDGISVKSSCEEERVECNAPDQVVSTGTDVDVIMGKVK
ncbi:hypothetical protein A4A49_10431 [Nicotiana attenuata]|uniref:DUF1985 domain-containing protein n=1 Tax=Nicotiana attenuata TaxID=49451 RepID=A0A1J6IF54_NICAT|nr:hypothetical protein A4A49_10431 [Nicotiana attenuata]